MAKVVVKKEIILTLTQEEADWILALSQNYFGEPSNETSDEYRIRKSIFDSLNLSEEF